MDAPVPRELAAGLASDPALDLAADAARARLALAAADLGDWSYDAATDRVSLSERAASIFGLPPSVAPTLPEFLAELGEEEAARARRAIAEALEHRRPYAAEYALRSRGDLPRTWVSLRALGRYGPDGAALGVVGVVQDVTDREEARRALHDREQRLRVAASVAALGIFEWHVLEDRALWENERMWEIFGRRPQEGTIGRAELFGSVLHPDDVAPFKARVAEALVGNGEVQATCRIRRASDGAWRWIDLAGRFQREETGRPGGLPGRMVGVVADVTDRHLAEERQQLLIRELHHRVKNTLATVQAIVGSTARTAPSVDAFYEAFVGRIMSLAHTHSVLTEATWQTASLRTLLESELKPYADPAISPAMPLGGAAGQALDQKLPPRVTLDGPDVALPSEIAVPIGMAIHELTTNAAKYGAFSNRTGRLAVAWAVEPEPAAPGSPPSKRQRLNFTWHESGGPPVARPTRQGFGSRLLQRVLTTQVQADVAIDYDPKGLRLVMIAPLPERNAALNPLAGV